MPISPQTLTPRDVQMPVPEDNFSLSQALVVFVVAGALASLASGLVVKPLKQRLSEAARIDLVGLADQAVRRIGDDLRHVAPQHIRVAGDGMTLELAPAVGARPDAPWLRQVAGWRVGHARVDHASPVVTYVCDLARDRLVRLEALAEPHPGTGATAPLTVLAEQVVDCRFAQTASGPAVSRVGLTLTLSQPTPAGTATVRREHWLPVGPGA